MTVVELPVRAEVASGSPNPFAVSRLEPPMVSAQQEGRRELTGIGVGLIVFGVLGFLGCVLILFSGQLHALGSIETIQTGILLAGGVVVALVIGGTSIFVVHGTGSATQRGAMGLLGGLLSGLMIFAFSALWILAAFIYLIEDCLRGCK
ncbi:MAG: hypothetical protein MUF23_09285 [Pirellula sp.]|nr:hypothetical protein [Pirellula sp.]